MRFSKVIEAALRAASRLITRRALLSPVESSDLSQGRGHFSAAASFEKWPRTRTVRQERALRGRIPALVPSMMPRSVAILTTVAPGEDR